jgi:hypothetical protein
MWSSSSWYVAPHTPPSAVGNWQRPPSRSQTSRATCAGISSESGAMGGGAFRGVFTRCRRFAACSRTRSSAASSTCASVAPGSLCESASRAAPSFFTTARETVMWRRVSSAVLGSTTVDSVRAGEGESTSSVGRVRVGIEVLGWPSSTWFGSGVRSASAGTVVTTVRSGTRAIAFWREDAGRGARTALGHRRRVSGDPQRAHGAFPARRAHAWVNSGSMRQAPSSALLGARFTEVTRDARRGAVPPRPRRCLEPRHRVGTDAPAHGAAGPTIARYFAAASSPSSRERRVAASTAAMSAARKPAVSSAWTPAIVVPPGLVTWSFSFPG